MVMIMRGPGAHGPGARRALLAWSAAGLAAAVLLPWYALQEGLGSGAWLSGLWSSEDHASGLAQLVAHGKWWLAPALIALAAYFMFLPGDAL